MKMLLHRGVGLEIFWVKVTAKCLYWYNVWRTSIPAWAFYTLYIRMPLLYRRSVIVRLQNCVLSHRRWQRHWSSENKNLCIALKTYTHSFRWHTDFQCVRAQTIVLCIWYWHTWLLELHTAHARQDSLYWTSSFANCCALSTLCQLYSLWPDTVGADPFTCA